MGDLQFGFLEFGIFDLLDVLLVSLLLFQLYKLLKGSLAFNIFLGLLLIYLAWMIVQALEMQLLGAILGQFIGLGVIALLIVFQPEVRRFLLLIGKSGRFQRLRFWEGLKDRKWRTEATQETVDELVVALNQFSSHRIGALLVIAQTSQLQFFANTGVNIDGAISAKLLESIFSKHSPIHDGAVILSANRVLAAGCTLPLSENPELPEGTGLRHRAAAGITENSDAIVIVVSEETGGLAVARKGHLKMRMSVEDMRQYLTGLFLGEEEE